MRFNQSLFGQLSFWFLVLSYLLAMTFANGQDMGSMAWPALGMGITGILAAIGLFQGKKTPNFPAAAWGLIAIFLYFLIRAILSPVKDLGEQDAILLLFAFGFWFAAFVGGNGIKNEFRLYLICSIIILSNILLFWYQRQVDSSIIPLRSVSTEQEGFGFFGHYNYFGHTFGAICLAALAFGIWSDKTLRWLWFGLCLISGLGAILSNSRGTLLSLAAGIIVFLICSLILQLKLRPKWFGPTLAASGIAIFVGAFALYFTATHIAESRGASSTEAISSFFQSGGRSEMTTIACEIGQSAPPTGLGARSFTYESIPFRNPKLLGTRATLNFVHNELAQAWCDYGIIGLISFIGALCTAFFYGIKQLSRIRILDSKESTQNAQRFTGRVVAGLCILGFGTMHALLDFAWHLLPTLALSAIALGWIFAPSPLTKTKPSNRITQYLFGSIFLIVSALLITFSWREFPSWDAEWDAIKAENRVKYLTKTSREIEEKDLLKICQLRQFAWENSPIANRGAIAGQSWLTLATSPICPPDKLKESAQNGEKILSRAIKLNPKDPYINLHLASTLDLLERYDEARKIYLTLLENSGEFGEISVPAKLHFSRHISILGTKIWYENKPGAALAYFLKAKEIFERGRKEAGWYPFAFARIYITQLNAQIELLQEAEIQPEWNALPPEILNY